MRNKNAVSVSILIGGIFALCLSGCHEQIGVLNPKGIIANEERKLFFDTLALMLIVVLPVIVMSFTFVYHYQVSHRVREYKPNWRHSVFLESLWWGIPCLIIFVLAILTWYKTHKLDPFNRIIADEEPFLIQVIGLPWKWLFIYPKENIASLNYLVLPANRQVEFWITVDNVPMSAFFIPQLGSQIYAMTGMRTRIHLLATETGDYEGLNALFNGAGFSNMHFNVSVVPIENFNQWINQVKQAPTQLTKTTYQSLLNPTIGASPMYFGSVIPNLFQDVIILYMNSLGPLHPRGITHQLRSSTIISGHSMFSGTGLLLKTAHTIPGRGACPCWCWF